jgi:hypothetical protein
MGSFATRSAANCTVWAKVRTPETKALSLNQRIIHTAFASKPGNNKGN